MVCDHTSMPAIGNGQIPAVVNCTEISNSSIGLLKLNVSLAVLSFFLTALYTYLFLAYLTRNRGLIRVLTLILLYRSISGLE